jgi:hypothetical protein
MPSLLEKLYVGLESITQANDFENLEPNRVNTGITIL